MPDEDMIAMLHTTVDNLVEENLLMKHRLEFLESYIIGDIQPQSIQSGDELPSELAH